MTGPDHPTLTLDAGRATDLEFASGSILLGRFKVHQPLGRGGMGAVFLVEDALSGETKALKAIPYKSISDLSDLSRELKAAHAVTGDGIVRYFDIFVDEELGCLLITMERVEGETLEAALKRRPFTPKEALRFLRRVAAILREVHAAGIVHQDLKPSNIFVLPDGGIKLGDFGISRFVDQDHGRVTGTPLYMAPEQRDRSRAVTGKADVYALGLILCEMLTGGHPASGMTVIDWRAARPEAAIAWERIPRALRGLLRRMVEPHADRRWGDEAILRWFRNRALLRAGAAAGLLLAVLVPAGLGARERLREQPVEAVIQGRTLTVHGATRLLWSKELPDSVCQAAVEDLDGDGVQEVLAGMRLEGWDALAREPFLRLFDHLGGELASYPVPIGIDRFLFQALWRAFPPRYFTVFSTCDLDGDGTLEWVARFQNDPLFPSITLFPPPKDSMEYNAYTLCTVHHCGALEFVGMWRGKMVFCGWNNHWLHSQALMVVDPQRLKGAGINMVPDASTTVGMAAYHLLGDADIVQPRGAGGEGEFALTTSAGKIVHRLTADFRLEGQASGAAEASLDLIEEDLNVFHQRLGMGDTAGALERAEKALGRAREFKLAGHVSLFAWCRSKALMVLGRTDEALEALAQGIDANPDLQIDLRLWMSLDALLAGRVEQSTDLARNLTHESCLWRAEDLDLIKGWIRLLAGRTPQEPGAEGGSAFPGNSDQAVYARLQAGWSDLLGKRPEEALRRFAPNLDRAGMEEHAAGLLLAEHLAGRTLPEEPRLLARCAAQPAIFRLALALKSGDRPGAEEAWNAVKGDRLHTANSAIFYCMMKQLARRYPERLGWIR